ncbi:hypothetical protein, partial [Aquitalea sp. ASV11]|uniref:hypothetical protein n=1 Tax=Aquitalea sp. ASV11 TaxID=2795103 RepID=UPI001E3DB705
MYKRQRSINYSSVAIGGVLSLKGSTCQGLFRLESVKVGADFKLHGLRIIGGVEEVSFSVLKLSVNNSFIFHWCYFDRGVRIIHSNVCILNDTNESWPSSRIDVDGFVYETLDGEAKAVASERILWLK